MSCEIASSYGRVGRRRGRELRERSLFMRGSSEADISDFGGERRDALGAKKSSMWRSEVEDNILQDDRYTEMLYYTAATMTPRRCCNRSFCFCCRMYAIKQPRTPNALSTPYSSEKLMSLCRTSLAACCLLSPAPYNAVEIPCLVSGLKTCLRISANAGLDSIASASAGKAVAIA